MVIHLRSSAFDDGGPIPQKYTADGENISPPLEWSGVPEGTVTFVLTCEDHDYTPGPGKEPYVHWLLYNVPAAITGLPEGLSTDARFVSPFPAEQGKTSFGRTGYSGPKPPVWHGPHRYFFKIYALDAELELEPGATKEELLDAMAGKVLEGGELVGLYKRELRKVFKAA